MQTKKKVSILSRNKQLAFLTACCLFLATLDYMIPKPLPFMRLGLANLPLLAGLPFLSAGSYFILLFAKVLVQGLVQGTLFSYVALFSLASSLTSGLIMFVVYNLGKRHISLVGVSMLGALASNLAQLYLAGLLIFRQAIWFLGPPFLILGSISGFILGTFAARFSEKSVWLRQLIRDQATADNSPLQQADEKTTKFSLQALPNRLFFCGLLIIPAFLLQNDLLIRLLQTVLFMLLAKSAGKKIKWSFSLILTASLLIVHLLTPNGEVLYKLGSFPVTLGAIRTGLFKATTFIGLIYLSLFAIHPRLHLPGISGGILGKIFFYFDKLQESYKSTKKQTETETKTQPVTTGSAGNARTKAFNRVLGYEKLIIRLDEILTLAYNETATTNSDPTGKRAGRKFSVNPFTGKPLQWGVLPLGLLIALNWLAYGLKLLF